MLFFASPFALSARALGSQQAQLSLEVLEFLEGLVQLSFCFKCTYLPSVFGRVLGFRCVFNAQYFAKDKLIPCWERAQEGENAC